MPPIRGASCSLKPKIRRSMTVFFVTVLGWLRGGGMTERISGCFEVRCGPTSTRSAHEFQSTVLGYQTRGVRSNRMANIPPLDVRVRLRGGRRGGQSGTVSGSRTRISHTNSHTSVRLPQQIDNAFSWNKTAGYVRQRFWCLDFPFCAIPHGIYLPCPERR